MIKNCPIRNKQVQNHPVECSFNPLKILTQYTNLTTYYAKFLFVNQMTILTALLYFTIFFGSGALPGKVFLRIIENKKMMLILGQLRLIKG